MEKFKQIAEDCLAGKLSGTFINRRGDIIPSSMLHKFDSIKYPYVYWENNCITRKGNYFYNEEKISDYDIINFIPDKKKEQITIDIPEGMEVVQETVNGEIRIKFIDKKPLDYYSIVLAQKDKHQFIHVTEMNEISKSFNRKAEVLSKLTNIRNYFGKPTNNTGYIITPFGTSEVASGYLYLPVFDTREHAQAAIDMLGDELKYLFEPW